MFELRLKVRLDVGPRWHFGSGLGRGSLDRAVARDAQGRPFIPGSHLKGVLRDHCERLCISLGLEVRDPHQPDESAARGVGKATRPLVDRLFGDRQVGECLYVGRACLNESQAGDFKPGGAGWLGLSRVTMDRALGRARDQRLFHTEYGLGTSTSVLMPDRQTTRFDGWLQTRHTKDQVTVPTTNALLRSWPLEWTVLVASLRMLDRLGGDRSTGAGDCRAEILSARVRINHQNWADVLWEDLLAPLDRRWSARLFQQVERHPAHGARLGRLLELAGELELGPDDDPEAWKAVLELFESETVEGSEP